MLFERNEKSKIIKIYNQKGLTKDIPYVAICEEFCIQELTSTSVEKYMYSSDSIKYELNAELVSLYDKLRNLFFADTDKYYSELNTMPIFVQRAGQDSDCGLTAETFLKLIQDEHFSRTPDFYRHLYLVDCQFLIGAIQNLLSGMDDAFIDYYVKISNIGNDIEPEYSNSTMIEMSASTRHISSLLESYFTKAYSILDLFCKLAYEFENPMQDFSSYKKMKSANLLWGVKKQLQINESVGTIFEKCKLIETIEALRNEVVHNGSWEFNPKVFVRFDNGEIVERFMFFPDIVQGHLATVKNRRHFFGSNCKVNDVLPKIHMKYMSRILNTSKHLNEYTLKN